MADLIQIRRDIKTEWESANPILFDGEFGLDKTSKKFKIGDGINAWNDLLYMNDVVLPTKLSDLINDLNLEGTYQVKKADTELYVSSTEKETWNGKANELHTHIELHTHSNKTHLDNYNPANFASNTHNHDENYQAKKAETELYVSSTEKETWNGKANEMHTHIELHTHSNKTHLDNYNPANFASNTHNHDANYQVKKAATELYVTASEKQTWNGKQNALTFKTFMNQSIIGTGNIEIPASGITKQEAIKISLILG